MRWATRPGIHVDRAASAWLITTYVDPEATFVYENDLILGRFLDWLATRSGVRVSCWPRMAGKSKTRYRLNWNA